VVWGSLGHCQVLRILHNPRYAGAFVFGRHHVRKRADGPSKIIRVAQTDWDTLIPGAHAGYCRQVDEEQNEKPLQPSPGPHFHGEEIGRDDHVPVPR
jgi:hypothetical protein